MTLLLVVIVLAAAAVVLFWKPGYLNKTVFDQDALQDGVTMILTNAATDDPAGYGYDDVADVICPADAAVTAGDSFTCTATVDGAESTITVTVVDAEGTYKVGLPK